MVIVDMRTIMLQVMQDRIASIPDALQGRVTSAFRLLSYTLRPVGLALTGILIQRIGAVNTMLIWGACIAAAEMTVVRLKGKHPHPIDPGLRAKLEKYLLPGF